MCGRFNVISDPMTKLLMQLTGVSPMLHDNLNIAPTESVAVITAASVGNTDAQLLDDYQLAYYRWWLTPSWSAGPSSKFAMFNARSETVQQSRAYKTPFNKQRCLIPLSGYYEWRKQGAAKQPYYIHAAKDEGLFVAGLWDRWSAKSSQGKQKPVYSCTMMTKEPHPELAKIHKRMPVIFDNKQSKQWLDGSASEQQLVDLMCQQCAIELIARPVDTAVNKASFKAPSIMEGVAEPINVSAKLH